VDRRAFIASSLSLLAAPLTAEAQGPGKLYRLGILSSGALPDPSVATSPNLVPKALRELGYIDGQTLSSNGGLPRVRSTGCARWRWR
jgi:hypothetical protein